MSIKSNIQKELGAVYTPLHIVNTILDEINYHENIYHKKIIDPSCGDGAFLIVVVERFIMDCLNHQLHKNKIVELLEENIIGFDIDEKAVSKCIDNLNLISEKFEIHDVKWNIHIKNSLHRKSIEPYFSNFDFVVGNPPYIRIQNLGEQKENVQRDWMLCKQGATDAFITFFELGYYLLKKCGVLGYITPNNYFKNKSSKALRNFFIDTKSLHKIIDFGDLQVFEKVTTYTCITILQKGNDLSELTYIYDNKGINERFNYLELNEKGWDLTEYKILEKIRMLESKGIPLGQLAKVRVGVTTLANSYYIFKDLYPADGLVKIKTKDNREFIIESDILKPIVKASVLKNENENQHRYIIFPYKKNAEGKHVIIPEDELQKKYPLTYQYFLSIQDILLNRDKGKPNSVAWYAFGRSQGLDTSFGKKIITSKINERPNFMIRNNEDETFYSGYSIKYDGDLEKLKTYLNSEDMDFYIKNTSKIYQHNYRSYAKSYIENFGVDLK